MTRFNLKCCLLAGLLVVAASQVAEAQRPAHFYPARPAFSSFLLYRQFNATGIPNYYTFVRHEQRFRDFAIQNQERRSVGIRQPLTIEGEVARELDNLLRQRAVTGIGLPAVPAQFGQTSHFFPRSVPARQR